MAVISLINGKFILKNVNLKNLYHKPINLSNNTYYFVKICAITQSYFNIFK